MRGEVIKAWESLGKDKETLNIEGKTDEELKVILEKLKAIKYSFDLLHSKANGVELAKGILEAVF